MPAPTTPDEFFELIKRSRLIDESRLNAHAQKLREADEWQTDVARLAGYYIRDGILTKFQAEQFLQGKWKRFELGKYRVLERLGAGGMGQVYLCEHKVMRRRVAVKVLPANKASDPSALERFHREARVVAALDHPNIVRAYDIDEDGQLHFLVMEYVDGSSLQDIVKQHGPMDPLRASHYIAQAAVGLQHAHEVAAIVHRDIKPGNLLLDRGGTLKILDMGLARFFHDEEDQITRNHDESVLGTADYLAPEQAIDSHTVDIRADIYSLGATFYFLLTGQPPFANGTIAQKLIWHQSKEPQPIRSLRPEVPEALTAIIAKMMQKNPAARYQVPIEVYHALQPWIQTPIAPPPAAEMPQLCLAAMGNSVGTIATRTTRPSYTNLALPSIPSGSVSSVAMPTIMPEMSSPQSPPTMLSGPEVPLLPAPEISKPPSSHTGIPAMPAEPSPSVPRPVSSQMNLPALPESIAPPTPTIPAMPTTPQPQPAPRYTQGLPPLDPISMVSMQLSAIPPTYTNQQPVSTPTPSNPLNLNSLGQPEPWDTLSDYDSVGAVAKPPSSKVTQPNQKPTPGKWRWIVVVVAIVLAVGGVAAVALRPKSTGDSSKLVKSDEPRVLKVSATGDGTHKRLLYAIAEAHPGDRIVVLDASITESVQIIKQKEITIEAGHPSGYLKWLPPPEARQLLNLEDCESVKIKGIRFDCANRVDVGVRLAKDCRGVLLEDVQISGARKVGLQLVNCLGSSQTPLKITRCRVEMPAKSEAAVRLFAYMKSGSGTTQFIHLHDCLLIGQRPTTGLVLEGTILDTLIERVTFKGFADGVSFRRQRTDQPVSVMLQTCRFQKLLHGLRLITPESTAEPGPPNPAKFEVNRCDFVGVEKMLELSEWSVPIGSLSLTDNTHDPASRDGNTPTQAVSTPTRPGDVGSTLQ